MRSEFVILLSLCANAASALRLNAVPRTFRTAISMSTESTEIEVTKVNPRDERRRILKSANYNRMGFKDEKQGVEEMMVEEFTSGVVAEMRKNNGVLKRGDITVKLAEYYGFCWGVERAIAMAYEARSHFPTEKLHITNEIIHNPQVNERLKEMDIQFLQGEVGNRDYSNVAEGDVVILPAFGATIQEMQYLDERKVKVVDTTCPWVSKVWNAVDNHRKAGQTSVIHGKYAHEETIATASFCDDYIIVKDMGEALYLTKYITEGGDKEEFMQKFKNAVSKGFDPEKHLKKVGLANQTTMYKRETKAIGRVLEKAMLKKYGPENLAEHYAEFDTICDATQERQDAVTDLVMQGGYTTAEHGAHEAEMALVPEEVREETQWAKAGAGQKLDFVLVVGGFDSSNTAHLKEIPDKFGCKSFHINRASCIREDNSIEHRTIEGEIVVEKDFLKKGPLTIGVTSGASTPDKSIEESLERIFLLHKLL